MSQTWHYRIQRHVDFNWLVFWFSRSKTWDTNWQMLCSMSTQFKHKVHRNHISLQSKFHHRYHPNHLTKYDLTCILPGLCSIIVWRTSLVVSNGRCKLSTSVRRLACSPSWWICLFKTKFHVLISNLCQIKFYTQVDTSRTPLYMNNVSELHQVLYYLKARCPMTISFAYSTILASQ